MTMPSSPLIKLLSTCAFVALLTGCASTGPASQSGLTHEQINSGQADLDASEVATALQVSKVFRQEKRYDDAIAVLMRASVSNPDDGDVYAEIGKVLVERGAPNEGLSFLNKAVQSGAEDWSIYSAAGVAYDQMSQHKKAQENYEMALLHAPNEPSVLSNLGLSYAMIGNLNEAEKSLRLASDQRGAGDVVRLNLALIVGLQGKFDEAQAIAQTELPPAFAARNIDHLRAMLTQPNRWQDMRTMQKVSSTSQNDSNGDVPSASH